MAITKDFVLAGDAVFTIDAPDKHRTYKVRLKPAKGNYPATYFVSTLAGPENTKDYVYVGILDPKTGQVRTTDKSKTWTNTLRLRLLNRVLAKVWAGDHAAYEAHGYKTHHMGRCGRCGHDLTTPQSIERGIGPECWKHLGMAT